jgi:hypothetical protein
MSRDALERAPVHGMQGAGRRLQVDRDALLHRYTVGPAHLWLAGPLTCTLCLLGGVVSKCAHGSGC